MCPGNLAHKAYLLKVEILFVEGRFDDAMCKYDQSNTYAKKSHFLNEMALANEKAARMLWYRQDARVVHYLNGARESYQLWGAHGKTTEMEIMRAKWCNND